MRKRESEGAQVYILGVFVVSHISHFEVNGRTKTTMLTEVNAMTSVCRCRVKPLVCQRNRQPKSAVVATLPQYFSMIFIAHTCGTCGTCKANNNTNRNVCFYCWFCCYYLIFIYGLNFIVSMRFYGVAGFSGEIS